MIITTIFNKDCYIVFDLDDTLYKERDFLFSAYQRISDIVYNEIGVNVYKQMTSWYLQGLSAFDELLSHHDTILTIPDLVAIYRNHIPNISLSPETLATLELLVRQGYSLGLMTDGRSISQRNKIKSLKLNSIFNDILISEEFGSEKPNQLNYLHFENNSCYNYFVYVGDNTSKDFITPNKLGWKTICLFDYGVNIHKQNFGLSEEYLPQVIISSILDLQHIFIG